MIDRSSRTKRLNTTRLITICQQQAIRDKNFPPHHMSPPPRACQEDVERRFPPAVLHEKKQISAASAKSKGKRLRARVNVSFRRCCEKLFAPQPEQSIELVVKIRRRLPCPTVQSRSINDKNLLHGQKKKKRNTQRAPLTPAPSPTKIAQHSRTGLVAGQTTYTKIQPSNPPFPPGVFGPCEAVEPRNDKENIAERDKTRPKDLHKTKRSPNPGTKSTLVRKKGT